MADWLKNKYSEVNCVVWVSKAPTLILIKSSIYAVKVIGGITHAIYTYGILLSSHF